MRITTAWTHFVVACALAWPAVAGDVESGKQLFHNTGRSGNGMACVTCHDTSESPADGILRPAHPLTQVLGRPSFWGGTLKTFAEAADYCAVKYLQIEGLKDAEKQDLESYVAQFGREPQPSLPLAKRTRRELTALSKLTPDPARGKTIADRSCVYCHTNKGPGPELEETLSPTQIIMVILSTGGKVMPFFPTDRLTDQDVVDVAAYVGAMNKSAK